MATNAGVYRAFYPEHATEPLKDCVLMAAEAVTFGYRMFEIADLADMGSIGALMHGLVRSGVDVNPDGIIDMMRKYEKLPNPIFRPIVNIYERLIAEMTLGRAVDSFLTYVSALLKLAFIHRPELLKTSDKVSAQQVLDHPTIESFVRWLADKRVHELSYQGICDLNSFFENRLGIPLIENKELPEVNRLIWMRNLLVHNRGVVNDHFIASVGTEYGTLGDKVRLSWHDATQGNITLLTAAVRLDHRAVQHLGLPTPMGWSLPDDLQSDDAK